MHRRPCELLQNPSKQMTWLTFKLAVWWEAQGSSKQVKRVTFCFLTCSRFMEMLPWSGVQCCCLCTLAHAERWGGSVWGSGTQQEGRGNSSEEGWTSSPQWQENLLAGWTEETIWGTEYLWGHFQHHHSFSLSSGGIQVLHTSVCRSFIIVNLHPHQLVSACSFWPASLWLCPRWSRPDVSAAPWPAHQ